jgi:hypothetical protein
MTKPSKAGVVVLSIFGLPFLGMGLFAAYTFLNQPNQPLPARIGAATFASVFAIIGGGLIYGSLRGYSMQKEQARREAANPASPWLWRDDWAAGRAESKNKTSARGWWVLAVLANMFLLPVSLGGIFKGLETREPIYLMPAAMGLVGLLVLFGAIRASIRLERFGKTYFEMASLPFAPGGRVAGSIHVHLDTDLRHGVDLKLWCTRTVITGSGNNRSSHKMPLWEESKNIPATALVHGPLDTMIPVEFTIPTDALQTDQDNFSDQIQWSLKVNADVPGVNYTDEFELPVFGKAKSPEVSAEAGQGNWSFETQSSQSGTSLERGEMGSETGAEVPEPEQHRVVVRDSPEGLEFYFRAGRNIFRAALFVVIAAACGALFYAMLQMQKRQPIFAWIIVGLLTFFTTLAAIRAALTSTRIVVGNGVISWRRAILGIGRTRQMQIADVASIQAVTSIQQASSSGSTLYALRLQTKAGKKRTLIDDIQSREEARWIVGQMEKRAGLRLNTEVMIADSIYGQPPQPGAVSAKVPAFAGKASIRIER